MIYECQVSYLKIINAVGKLLDKYIIGENEAGYESDGKVKVMWFEVGHRGME